MGTVVSFEPNTVRRLIAKNTIIFGDDERCAALPYEVVVLVRTLETEAGIQYLGSAVGRPDIHIEASTSGDAVLGVLKKIVRIN